MPLFTIVTATYNAASVIRELGESLAEQTCRDFEWVVQDGGSTDATAAEVQHYESILPSVRWQSVPDYGIYDAWNKAIARASGEWVIFLGADDRLATADVLERVHAVLTGERADLRFASGGLDIILPDGRLREHIPGRSTGVRARLRQQTPVGNPSLFYRRSLFQEGLFDPRYRIAGDHDLLARLWRDDAEAITLDFTVSRMIAGGVSDNPRNLFLALRETVGVVYQYFGITGVVCRLGCLARELCSRKGVWKILGTERGRKFQQLLGKDQ